MSSTTPFFGTSTPPSSPVALSSEDLRNKARDILLSKEKSLSRLFFEQLIELTQRGDTESVMRLLGSADGRFSPTPREAQALYDSCWTENHLFKTGLRERFPGQITPTTPTSTSPAHF